MGAIDGWIYFCVEPGKLPQDYLLTYAKLSVGITLYKVDDVLIHNLTVQGFQLDGINAHDSTGPCRLIEVTARNNGRSGVAVVEHRPPNCARAGWNRTACVSCFSPITAAAICFKPKCWALRRRNGLLGKMRN